MRASLTTVTFSVLTLLSGAHSLLAQSIISWEPSVDLFDPAAADPQSFVDITGLGVVAYNATATTTLNATVNGVIFTPQVAGTPVESSDTTRPESIIIDDGRNSPGAFGDGAFAGSDIDIANLIAGASFDIPSVTINDLVVGQEYLIQIFTHDGRSSRSENTIAGFGDGSDDGTVQGTSSLSNAAPGVGGTGDSIIGLFTATAGPNDNPESGLTSLTFNVFGTGAGADSDFGTANSQSQINAIQLRAVGALLPVPASLDPNSWTGLNGSTLDANTTANFTLNAPAAPLTEGTLAQAGLFPFFGDTYAFNGTTPTVATSIINIPANEIIEAAEFSFINTTESYEITSNDLFGIGGTTELNLTGSGAVTLLGTHSYSGDTTIDNGSSLQIGGSSSVAELTNSQSIDIIDGTVTYNSTAGDINVVNSHSGSGTLVISGGNTVSHSAASTLTGQINILDTSTYLLTANLGSPTYDITQDATVQFDGGLGGVSGTFSGLGTLLKTSAGQLNFGNGTFALSAGSTIEVQGGEFRASSSANENWVNNLSNLTITDTGVFFGQEGNVIVDAINGDGTLTTGFNASIYDSFTFGAADGSGSFSGSVTNGAGTGHLRKIGTGTQVFSGDLSYTGNTIIQNGTVDFASGAIIRFFPTTNAVTNQITGDPTAGRLTFAGTNATGTGEVVINSIVVFDVTNADLVEGNFWPIVDQSQLASVTYGPDFAPGDQDVAFTETAPGIWTGASPLSGVDFMFVESTGILSLGEPILPPSVIEIVDCGFEADGDFFIELAVDATGAIVNQSPDLTDGSFTEVAEADVTIAGNIITIAADAVDIDGDGASFFQVSF